MLFVSVVPMLRTRSYLPGFLQRASPRLQRSLPEGQEGMSAHNGYWRIPVARLVEVRFCMFWTLLHNKNMIENFVRSCDQFPESRSGGVCMDPPPEKEVNAHQNNMFPSGRGNTFGSNNQDSSIRQNVPNYRQKDQNLVSSGGKKCEGVPLRRGSILHGANISYGGVPNCAPPCKWVKVYSRSLYITWRNHVMLDTWQFDHF